MTLPTKSTKKETDELCYSVSSFYLKYQTHDKSIWVWHSKYNFLEQNLQKNLKKELTGYLYISAPGTLKRNLEEKSWESQGYSILIPETRCAYHGPPTIVLNGEASTFTHTHTKKKS